MRDTQEDHDMLTTLITRKELKHALFQMQPDKSLRSDGFNPTFYHYFSHVYGEYVFKAIRLWLEHGFFPTNFKETNICLIHKCENPEAMKDLRPISLSNVLYKMILKLLMNR